MATKGFGKVTLTDKGYKAFIDKTKELKDKPHVAIGIRGNEAAELKKSDEQGGVEQVTLVLVATVMEFGSASRNVPPRLFITGTMTRNLNTYKKMMGDLLGRVSRPNSSLTIEQALGIAGEKVRSDIRTTIVRSIDILPVSQATQRRKGPDKTTPLINTGQLVQGLTYEVRLPKINKKGAE